MKNKTVLIVMILIGINSVIFPQSHYRNGIFLHHSTGERIWGPNGSTTSVLQEMNSYNFINGYIGNDSVSLDQTWFPSGDDNEWYTWHRIFDNLDPNNDIQPYLQNNKIVVIKSCYPSSNVIGLGSPGDTLTNPSIKTVYNYKWHWRRIIRVMQQHPENFFVIWTNAPLVPNATNSDEAALANQFCSWAKDTLATGNDPFFGIFPSNVYVFDFFHKLADENGMLILQYAASSSDSHPNGIATELVAPQFVQEIFSSSIAYEGVTTVELTPLTEYPITSYRLEQNYPNPFNPNTKIQYSINRNWFITLKVYNALGIEIETLVNELKAAGTYEINWNAANLPSGNYFYRLQADDFVQTRKMILLK